MEGLPLNDHTMDTQKQEVKQIKKEKEKNMKEKRKEMK